MELKPCPFCGGDKVWIRQIDMGKFHYAECQGCLAITTYHDTKAEAITAWNRRADGWIPVTERLPEDTRDVLVWCGITEKGCYSPSQHMWGVYDDGYSPIPVTHWMPLPQPPEVK